MDGNIPITEKKTPNHDENQMFLTATLVFIE